MADTRELEKQLKLAAKTGKYVVGRREVLGGLKGSKLLVWSTSANVPQKILDESRSLSIPAVKFDGNPVELGKACGIPFRVSVIAVKARANLLDRGAYR
jgi:large subunit ribosomal protein L30e